MIITKIIKQAIILILAICFVAACLLALGNWVLLQPVGPMHEAQELKALRVLEQEKQKTLQMQADYNRQVVENQQRLSDIEAQKDAKASPITGFARIGGESFKALWPLWAFIAFGGLMFYVSLELYNHAHPSRVFKFGSLETTLPEKQALHLSEKALYIEAKKAEGQALALEDKLNTDILNNTLRTAQQFKYFAKSATPKGALKEAEFESKDRPMLQANIPKFKDLLQQGIIGKEDTIVYGITESGEVFEDSFDNTYSTGIAGDSGTGKTVTATSIIAQTALSCDYDRIFIGDPHIHNKKGENIVARLGNIVSLPNIVHNDSPFAIKQIIQDYNALMQLRLSGKDQSTSPLILVLDEFLFIIKHIELAYHVILDLATQGRKFGCYGLFLSQNWKGNLIRGTEVRDSLMAKITHRLEKRQANTWLQDNDIAKQVKRLGRGEVYFENIEHTPRRLFVPYVSQEDTDAVYNMAIQQEFKDITPQSHSSKILKQVQDYVRKHNAAILADKSGINKGTLSKILSGEASLTDTYIEKLQPILQEDN